MSLQMIEIDPLVVASFFSANAVGFTRPYAIRFKGGILSPGAYINNRVLPSWPVEWQDILTRLFRQADKLRGDYNVIASVANGGVPHGIAIARHVHVPHFTIKKQEKEHGLTGLIDGNLEKLAGARVLLVEDMSSTFASSLKAIETLEHHKARVVHTLLLNTWRLPDFDRNVADRSVFTLCDGAMFLDEAIQMKMVDKEHESIVRYWLKHPEDQTWFRYGWRLPEQERDC